MQTHEYKAIPAPRKAVSAKGVKGTSAKFAHAVSILMNEMATDGWQYQRTDTLPCEERQGLTGKAVKYHALMVFSRPIAQDIADDLRLALPSPADVKDDASNNDDDDVETVEDTPEDDATDHDTDNASDDDAEKPSA